MAASQGALEKIGPPRSPESAIGLDWEEMVHKSGIQVPGVGKLEKVFLGEERYREMTCDMRSREGDEEATDRKTKRAGLMRGIGYGTHCRDRGRKKERKR